MRAEKRTDTTSWRSQLSPFAYGAELVVFFSCWNDRFGAQSIHLDFSEQFEVDALMPAEQLAPREAHVEQQ